MTQQADSALATMKPTARSKMTNARFAGKVTSRALFLDGDGRSPWSRRYRDLVALFADDAGGIATLTELKLGLIRRAAALTVECERMENALADGEEIDIDLLARLSSHTRRISETIGIERAKRDSTPDLGAILREHAKAEKAAAKPTKRPRASEGPTIASEPENAPSACPQDDDDALEREAAE